jgi:hypothetical protein
MSEIKRRINAGTIRPEQARSDASASKIVRSTTPPDWRICLSRGPFRQIAEVHEINESPMTQESKTKMKNEGAALTHSHQLFGLEDVCWVLSLTPPFCSSRERIRSKTLHRIGGRDALSNPPRSSKFEARLNRDTTAARMSDICESQKLKGTQHEKKISTIAIQILVISPSLS